MNDCVDSDVLLCSCYVWNWEITTKFAMEVKKKNAEQAKESAEAMKKLT